MAETLARCLPLQTAPANAERTLHLCPVHLRFDEAAFSEVWYGAGIPPGSHSTQGIASKEAAMHIRVALSCACKRVADVRKLHSRLDADMTFVQIYAGTVCRHDFLISKSNVV